MESNIQLGFAAVGVRETSLFTAPPSGDGLGDHIIYKYDHLELWYFVNVVSIDSINTEALWLTVVLHDAGFHC